MFTFLLDIKGFLTAPDVKLFHFSLGVNVRNGQIDPNKPPSLFFFFPHKIYLTLIWQGNIKNKASFLMGRYDGSSICKTAGRWT